MLVAVAPAGLGQLVTLAGTNAVSLVLGEEDPESGLRHLRTEADGSSAVATILDKPCRYLNLSAKIKAGEWGYFYFALDPDFKQGRVGDYRIEIEYYSETSGEFGVQYDAQAATKSLSSTFRDAGATVHLKGLKQWQTAVFHLRGAAFQNSQNGHADFRIWTHPPELYVRRVTVSRETTPASPSPPPSQGARERA